MIDHECTQCGQVRIEREFLRAVAEGRAFVCAPCREREREPQGTVVRLFTPAPNQIAGQIGLDV